MFPSTVISLFGSLSVIASLGVVALLLYAILRTGSPHILMFRLWRLASGGVEVHDERIRAYLHDQHALMQFRFVTGLPVKRMEDAHALVAWSAERDISVEQLSQAGDYFDLKQRLVRSDQLPKGKELLRHSFMLMLFAILSWLSLSGLLLVDSALVKFRGTSTYFVIDDYSAERFPSFKWNPIFVSDCPASASLIESSGFTAGQAQTICKSFADAATRTQISQALRSQRIALAMLGVLFSLGLIRHARYLRRAKSAKRLEQLLASTIVADNDMSSRNCHLIEERNFR